MLALDDGWTSVTYLFWRKNKGKREYSGCQVSERVIHVFLWPIHIEAGHWALAWLVEMACDLGWSALDERGPGVPCIEGRSKSPWGEPILRCFCESWSLLMMCGLLCSWFLLRANTEVSIFLEGDSPTWCVFRQGLLPKSSTVDPTQEPMVPLRLRQGFSCKPLWEPLLKHHSRRAHAGDMTLMLGWQDPPRFKCFWLVKALSLDS